MLKLYSKADGKFRYHEAWVDDDGLVEHWGAVGTKGRTRTHPLNNTLAESTQVRRLLAPIRAAGFKPLRANQHRMLVVEYKIRGFGSSNDVRKRHKLQDRLANLLGWLGLGHCDGGSMGHGVMDVCCLVVDFAVAQRAIIRDLRDSSFANYVRIYDDGAA
jgi:predicted DNA-binding WGR domain protein